MEIPWFWATLIIVLIATNLLLKKNKKLPPSPIGLPILGHLHMLGKNSHHDLHKIAQKHGPIMYMRFGLSPIIVVSSAEAAELFLKTHDLVFASRPPVLALKYMQWDQSGLSFAAYGPYWRSMRKLCTLQLLSSLKIASFRDMRREELGFFVESIKEAARDNVAVDLSARVAGLAAEMSCRMLFGKKYDDKEIGGRGFKGVFQEGMHLAAIPNLGDYFPFLEPLDLQGLTRKMKALAKMFDQFLEKVIDDSTNANTNSSSVGNEGGKAKDIVCTLMEIMRSGESKG